MGLSAFLSTEFWDQFRSSWQAVRIWYWMKGDGPPKGRGRDCQNIYTSKHLRRSPWQPLVKRNALLAHCEYDGRLVGLTDWKVEREAMMKNVENSWRQGSAFKLAECASFAHRSPNAII
jgi:hypothetical protein